MEVDILSRIQFALTAGFHFLFPPISIGLGVFIVLVEAAYLRSSEERFKKATQFFLKLFAVIFAVGVVTGIVLEFEFGTNWPVYSNFVGDVFGSPLAIEAVFAFFMESVFLGIALWGWDRVGKTAHFVSTFLMCLGAHLSAVWIIVANSFMQTPDGFALEYTNPQTGIVETLAANAVPATDQILHTRAVITNFWEMALNSSMMDRLTHTLSASWLCGAFFALGVCGYLILRNRTDFAKSCAKIALVYSVVAMLYMFFTGHSSAQLLATTQPEKLSAFEGHYETSTNAPLYLFGWVDETNRKVIGLKADGLYSLLAFGAFSKEVKGLNDLPSNEFLSKIYPNATPEQLAKERPKYWAPVNFSFQTFRIMVYLGCAIFIFIAWGLYLWFFKEIFNIKRKGVRLFWICSMFSLLMPLLASQFGWAAAEVGRQPWIVWHILKTSDAVTTTAAASEIMFSIILFTFIFTIISIFAVRVLFKKIKSKAEE